MTSLERVAKRWIVLALIGLCAATRHPFDHRICAFASKLEERWFGDEIEQLLALIRLIPEDDPVWGDVTEAEKPSPRSVRFYTAAHTCNAVPKVAAYPSSRKSRS